MKIQTPADAARAIKTRRLARGLTQLEVAQAIGVTRQSLARIEQGNGGGAFDTYLRLFDLLGIDLRADAPIAATVTVAEPAAGSSADTSLTHKSAIHETGREIFADADEDRATALRAARVPFEGLDHLQSVIESLESVYGASAPQPEGRRDGE